MSDDPQTGADAVTPFDWQAESPDTWAEAADVVSRLLTEVEAGRLEATPAELASLRTFVATVRGVTCHSRLQT